MIREIELKNNLDNDRIADDSLDLESGPFVVNLNLDGSLNPISVNEVPAGKYDEIEFEIHKPEDNETPDPDFKIVTSGDERFSVIVRGPYNGQGSLYRSTENMEQEIELPSLLVIEEAEENINVTMAVDISHLFVDENGNDLEDNRDEIDEAIKRSFEAFTDNEEDERRTLHL